MSKKTLHASRMPRLLARAVYIVAAGIGFHAVVGIATASAQTEAFHHLYVADSEYNAVYRFKLSPDGLPQTTPDLTLQYSGFDAPYGLAVDSSGSLYVASSYNHQIDVFAPGASGDAQPIRQLSLGADYAQHIAVNLRGFLFVDNLNLNAVSIYAPGAHGNAVPLHSIALWGRADPIWCITVDTSGRLYVLPAGAKLDIFNDPLVENNPDIVLQPQGNEFSWGDVLAVDQSRDLLYMFYGPEYEYPPNPFAVRTLKGASLDKRILTQACTPGYGNGFGTDPGAAISGRYLIFSCLNTTSVYVYNAFQFGVMQNPVETIGHIGGPEGIILGP